MTVCSLFEKSLLLNKTLLCDCLLQVSGTHNELQDFSQQSRCCYSPFSLDKIVPAPTELKDEDLLRWRLLYWGCVNNIDPTDLYVDMSVGNVINNEVSYVLEYEFSSSPYPPIYWLQAASALFTTLDFSLSFNNPLTSNTVSAQRGKLLYSSLVEHTKLRLEQLM